MKIILTLIFGLSTICFGELPFETPMKDLMDKKVYKAPKTYFVADKDKGEIKALFYETLPFQGKPTRAFAYIGIPKSNKPVPAVVCVHGGGGTAFHEWVKIWNDRGYAAISMSLEGHMPSDQRKKLSHEYSGPVRKGRFDDITEPLDQQWMYHAVSNVMLANSLLRSLEEIDPEQIGITGISWGGILTSLVSGVDDRFKFAIPVYGAGFLYHSLGHFASVQGDQKFWDPARQFQYTNTPILWVNGDNDGHFSLNITSESYLATKERSWISTHPGLPHGHGAGWDPKRVPVIYDFADKIVKGEKVNFGRISVVEDSNFKTYAYDPAVEIKSATVYYTDKYEYNKVEGSKHKRPRPWKTVTAQINSEKQHITVDLPDEAKVFYLNLVDENGLTFSSELFDRSK